jgi:hypothetical protein
VSATQQYCIGNKTAPGELLGNQGGVRLTSNRISPQDASCVVDAEQVNDAWMVVGTFACSRSDRMLPLA